MPFLPEVFAQSPWVDYRDIGADTLLITFSSVLTPRGKCTPYVAVNELPFDILRFNCPDSTWYVGGIPETDLLPGAFTRMLDEFIRQNRYRKVILFGGSKGGFGALDIGLRIRSDVIISTGPETLFGHPHGYAVNYVSPARIERAKRRIAGWPEANLSRKRALHILFGNNAKVDRLFAAEATRLLGVDCIMIAGCDHSVPQFVAQRYSLSRMIANFAESGTDAFIAAHTIEHAATG